MFSSLPIRFQDINSVDKLSDDDVIAETLQVTIPLIKKHQRKFY